MDQIGSSRKRVVNGRRRAWQIMLTCLLMLFSLIMVAESVVRVCGWDRPLAGAVAFAGNADDPIHEVDAQVFYRLRPDLHMTWQGAEVNTNSLGLRSPELGPKQPGEFRILSLGESTTFGAGVADESTYSARLEDELQSRDGRRAYRVINAGVSGYTSFQSLKYLEARGLDLEPDVVLFYHEINDQLPVLYSDRELYESRAHAWHRDLAEWSAVYRALSARVSERKIAAQRDATPAGAPDLPAGQRISGEGHDAQSDRVRVSPVERRRVFRELAELCAAHGVTLVFIHPAYSASTRHTCELTEFCAEAGAWLYEAHDSLHPEGSRPEEYFLDECHPNKEGHGALARGLAEYLIEVGAVPPDALIESPTGLTGR